MTQIALALEFSEPAVSSRTSHARAAHSPTHTLNAFESEGFAIGWDHARYGVVPPVDHLHPGHPVRQGWDAFRARSLAPHRCAAQPSSAWAVGAWLGLRLAAWARSMPVEPVAVTVSWIRRLRVTHCPITREALTWGLGLASDAQVVVLNEAAGVAAGNLAVVSRRAAAARALGGDAQQAVAHAQALRAPGATHAGLDTPAWKRWAGLISLATPLPHARVSAQALTVFPPPRVRVLNAAQAVQTMLSSLWMGPGYARRLADVSACLSRPLQRRRLSLLMSALLARRLEQGWSAHPHQVRHALEDAWGHPAVLRRWQDLMQCLDAPSCERWVRRVLALGAAHPTLRWMDAQRATEGWAVSAPPSQGEVVIDDHRCVV